MIALLCPGQGSQKPGFMSAWLEIPEYRSNIEILSDVIKMDLIKHGTESDEATIRDTAIAQPLIVAASIASANLLAKNFSAVAGHSVGEVPAGYLAGILSQEQAISLVDVRAKAMAKAATAAEKTGMAAILGGDQDAVVERLTSLGLSAANYNGAGQIVAAGAASGIEALVANPVEGTKVIPLAVAGAFHTQYMNPAVAELEVFAKSLEISEPTKTIWSNQAGQEIKTSEKFIQLLVGQVANSVRWDLCMSSMVAAGVTGVIEVSPAGTLAGLAKRGMPDVEIIALKTPADIETANSLMARG